MMMMARSLAGFGDVVTGLAMTWPGTPDPPLAGVPAATRTLVMALALPAKPADAAARAIATMKAFFEWRMGVPVVEWNGSGDASREPKGDATHVLSCVESQRAAKRF